MVQTGLHHVTAFSGPALRNLDFHTRVLGLRLVKKTVNFDDPGTYHLYYGDGAGRPGTILTFFPIEHAAPGRVGVGETQETAFRVPRASIGWWTHRLIEKGVGHEPLVQVFGESTLRFRDPDGLMLALVGVDGDDAEGWASGEVPAEHAIRGLHGVTLLLDKAEPTAAILTQVLGLDEVGCEGNLIRFAGSAGIGNVVTLRAVGGFLPGRPGAGSVHHRPRWPTPSRRGGSTSPSSATGSTSARSTSASPAGCCSRSPRMRPASRSTNPWRRWAAP
jgi:glyoxalase family protein